MSELGFLGLGDGQDCSFYRFLKSYQSFHLRNPSSDSIFEITGWVGLFFLSVLKILPILPSV